MDLLLVALLLLRLLEPAQSAADGDNGKKKARPEEDADADQFGEPNEAHNEYCRYCEIRRHFITNTDVPVNESAKVG